MESWIVLIAALIAALSAMVSPIILSSLQSKQRLVEKEQDYARQDEVAKKVTEAASQAAKAAELLVESNANVAKFAAEGVAASVAARKAVEEQKPEIEKIHNAVNSTATEARETIISLREDNKNLVAEMKKQQLERLKEDEIRRAADYKKMIEDFKEVLRQTSVSDELAEDLKASNGESTKEPA